MLLSETPSQMQHMCFCLAEQERSVKEGRQITLRQVRPFNPSTFGSTPRNPPALKPIPK